MHSPDNSLPWRLEWGDGLSVGIPEIDAEHQRFVMLINDLNRAIVGRMGVEQIKSLMQDVIDDAVVHFAHEENLFSEWGYPEAVQHAQRHVEVLLALQEILQDFEQGGLEYELIQAGMRVKAALIQHLLTEDMKYRDYRRGIVG